MKAHDELLLEAGLQSKLSARDIVGNQIKGLSQSVSRLKQEELSAAETLEAANSLLELVEKIDTMVKEEIGVEEVIETRAWVMAHLEKLVEMTDNAISASLTLQGQAISEAINTR